MEPENGAPKGPEWRRWMLGAAAATTGVVYSQACGSAGGSCAFFDPDASLNDTKDSATSDADPSFADVLARPDARGAEASADADVDANDGDARDE